MLRRDRHTALQDRVREKIADKRVLALVKAFLKAGKLHEEGVLEQTTAGTPQGSILSPLLSRCGAVGARSAHRQGAGRPGRQRGERRVRLRWGLPNYRLIRYADDWCLMVKGTRADAEALREEIAGVLESRMVCACLRKRPWSPISTRA